MKYYYANAQNQPTGPVELDALREMLASGLVTPMTNVLAEGSQSWTPLSSALKTIQPVATQGLAEGAGIVAQKALAAPTLLADLVGRFIDWQRRTVSAERFATYMRFFTTAGQLLVVVGAALGLILAIVAAVRANPSPGYNQANGFTTFVIGLGIVLAIAIFQYVAKRFLEGSQKLVVSSPSRISSLAILDCFALLALCVAVAVVAGSGLAAIATSRVWTFLVGLMVAVTFRLAAIPALHPSLVNIESAEASAGEEATGIVSFFLKLALVLLPFQFFVGALLGIVLLLAALFTGIGSQSEAFVMGVYPSLPGFSPLAGLGLLTLVLSTLLPFIAYLLFLFAYLTVDLIRAIVSVPAKLDALRK